MPATPEDLMAMLDRLAIATTTVEHPPLHTVEESRALRGDIPGAHTKNLFVKDKKGGLFLLTALEDTTINLKAVHRHIGAKGRVSFGRAEVLMEALGVPPGAVTAFALMNDDAGRVSFALDRALMDHPTVNCHPLVNTMTTTIRTADLIAFAKATGHQPQIVALGEV